MPFEISETEGLRLPVIILGTQIAYPYIPINFEFDRQNLSFDVSNLKDSEQTVLLAFSKDPDVFTPGDSELFSVGVIAKIDDLSTLPSVTLRGICRADVLSFSRDNGMLFSSVIPEEYAPDTPNGTRKEALRRHIIAKLREFAKLIPQEGKSASASARDIADLGQLADFAAFTSFANFEDKLAVLAIKNHAERAIKVCEVLEKDEEYLKEEIFIHHKIQKSLERSQYENYLREKVKVIREELGDEDDEIDEYLDKIEATSFSADKKISEEIKDKLTKEVARLSKMQFGSPEAVVVKGYLDTCLELPWDVTTKDTIDIEAAKKILDEDHDGLEKPKERILEYLAVKQLNPNLRNQILCFVGPPGVGKTSLGISIARAMGRKYARVSLGGIHDEAEIRGHRKTYIGSMPGRIIEAIERAGSRNPVLLLDEIDKMCASAQGDPSSAMLEVLDAEQNNAYRDHYIELPFDLSNVMFITTANTTDSIPAPLLDRMELIELDSYTREEKLNIAKKHLLPKQMKRHGLSRSVFSVTDGAILEIIDFYTREAGVREVERELAAVCRKAAKEYLENGKRIKVDEKAVGRYLGVRKFRESDFASEGAVGTVNGLAWTSVGGVLLPVEVSALDGSGKLELTGQLGDVMKESARTAVSFIRSRCDALGIDKDFYKTKDIHIHAPEGAVPKDGPSAGITIALALASALSGRKVAGGIAMTGEITLRGRVLQIGGLKEKSMAAYRHGIKRVIIPKENLPDLEDISKTVREATEFIPVSHMDEVLALALEKDVGE